MTSTWLDLRLQRLRDEVSEARAEIVKLTAERDAARAEVERWQRWFDRHLPELAERDWEWPT